MKCSVYGVYAFTPFPPRFRPRHTEDGKPSPARKAPTMSTDSQFSDFDIIQQGMIAVVYEKAIPHIEAFLALDARGPRDVKAAMATPKLKQALAAMDSTERAFWKELATALDHANFIANPSAAAAEGWFRKHARGDAQIQLLDRLNRCQRNRARLHKIVGLLEEIEEVK